MKKIYDIIPPELAGKSRQISQEKIVEKKKTKKFSFKWLGAVVIILFLLAFFVEGRAVVTIYPKTNDIFGEEMVTIALKQGVLDEENKIIPAIIFSDDVEESSNYSATGSIDKSVKARAVIRVFNKYKPEKSITLVKGTRFLSVPGELIYRAVSGFTIPPAQTIDGKFTPGYVDVEVEADQAGEEYNLSSATFSVPGLNGTEYYPSIWGETINPIAGGLKAKVSVVLQKDIDNAKDDFEKNLIAKGKEELKKTIPSNYIFFDEDFVFETRDIAANIKAGAEATSFSVSGKLKIETKVFRKEDLESLLTKNISSKKIVPDSLTYNIVEKKNVAEGAEELKISFSAKTYWLPENDFLQQNVVGKSKDYALSLLEGLPEVEKAEIKLIPFWKLKAPNSKDRIEINISF